MKHLGEVDCRDLDAQNEPRFGRLRAMFAPGSKDTLYFDAGSIGPMPQAVPQRMQQTLDAHWRVARRRSWNEADWLEQPRELGASLAPLLGAAGGELVVCDSTSVNLYKLLRYALSLVPDRQVLVVERDPFPTDRYVAEGIAHAGLAQLRFVSSAGELEAALAPGDVAAIALSHVDYRSSERLDMKAICSLARRNEVLTVWDLSHSAGAVRIDLQGCGADLAVSCGYKYLSGGPGAPAVVYVSRRWHDSAWPALCGWMGHAATFAFQPEYAPARGPARLLVGSPPVLANVAFSAAADIWRQGEPEELDAHHRSLSDTLIALLEQECAGFGLEIQSPREHARRGGHVAVRFDAASALAQALVDRDVIVSSRADTLRFGIHPIVTQHLEVWQAVQRLRALLSDGAWREPRYQRQAV